MRRPPRDWHLALIMLWGLSVVMIAVGGATPGYWQWRTGDTSYPLSAVVWTCVFSGAVLNLLVTDQPGYVYAHGRWQLLVCALLLGLLLVSASSAVTEKWLKWRREP